MKSKAFYRITLTNFFQHNSQLKKSHKATLISNNFFNDAKVMMLPTHTQLLLLKLILTCGDHCHDTITLTKQQLNNMLSARQQVENALNLLQSLQILSYEKNDLFINRNEEKGIERKRKEENNTGATTNPEAPKLSLVPTQVTTAVAVVPAHSSKQLHKSHSVEELSSLLDNTTKQNLLNLYPEPEFIKREFIKMQIWLDANPRRNSKTTRGWSGFVSNWLDKGWPKFQQSIPANKVHGTSTADLAALMGWSL